MTKLIIVLMLIATTCNATTYYRMSQGDYVDLCSQKAKMYDMWSRTDNTSYYMKWRTLEGVISKLKECDTNSFSKDIDWELVDKILKDYKACNISDSLDERLHLIKVWTETDPRKYDREIEILKERLNKLESK